MPEQQTPALSQAQNNVKPACLRYLFIQLDCFVRAIATYLLVSLKLHCGALRQPLIQGKASGCSCLQQVRMRRIA